MGGRYSNEVSSKSLATRSRWIVLVNHVYPLLQKGTATVSENGKKLTLLDDSGRKVDIAMIGNPVAVGDEITTEKQYMINIEKYLATSPKIEQKDATSYATPAMPERKFATRGTVDRGSRYSFKPPLMARPSEGDGQNSYARPKHTKGRPDPPVKRPILGLSQLRPKRRTNDDILHLLGRVSKSNNDSDSLQPQRGSHHEDRLLPQSILRQTINHDLKNQMGNQNQDTPQKNAPLENRGSSRTHLESHDQRNTNTPPIGEIPLSTQSPKVSYSIFMEDEEDGFGELDISFHPKNSQSTPFQTRQFPDSSLLSSKGECAPQIAYPETNVPSESERSPINAPGWKQPQLVGRQTQQAASQWIRKGVLPHSDCSDFTGKIHTVSRPVAATRARTFAVPKSSREVATFVCTGTNSNSEIFFPSAPPVDAPEKKRRKREAVIADSFSSCRSYQTSLLNALVEQLNLQLDELSTEYHRTKTSIDMSAYNPETATQSSASAAPHCKHGPSKLCTVQKEGKNKGCHFYACPKPKGQGCNFFLWADQHQNNDKSFPMSDNRVKVSSANDIEQVFRANGICLFVECYLQRSKRTWRGRNENDNCQSSKTVFLSLDRCSRGMAFAKRDLWVVSSSLNFETAQTVVLESVFFGPSSEGCIELKQISGIHAGVLKSNIPLYAMKAFNSASELKCVESLTKGIKELPTLPVLPTLLGKRDTIGPRGSYQVGGKSMFLPQQVVRHTCTLYISTTVRDQLCEEYIANYTLNADQSDALRTCTNMLTCYDSSDSLVGEPVVLIHGVFGAGKSYFVAVLVLLVCKLFALSDSEEFSGNSVEDSVKNEKQQNRSVLISSGTNVAVDRILQSLLDMGMSDFVRVGSARKIAPTVLPYSTHGSSSSDNKGIRDLKQMLTEDGISMKEKKCIRDSIDRMKQGVNMQLLKSTRVVAATLAATEFQCMQGLSFPFVILDEACQMTEPNALLPISRFNCQNLVLVGDPKQLSPAIPGAEAEHTQGLEQSMFQRLMKTMPPASYKMLGIQYRCHPTISSMANRLTYEGKLRDGVTDGDRTALVKGMPPLCFFDCDSGTEERQGGGSYRNCAEAQFIVFVIEFLLSNEVVEPSEIGVISTYKAQAKYIQDLLKESDHPGCKLVISSTVDAFQGGEREVILLSCVRTSGVGFIDDPDRTNVALTRSKRHLFIVGRQHTLWRNELWHGVLNYCFQCFGGKSDVQQGRSALLDLLEEHTRMRATRSLGSSPTVGLTGTHTISAHSIDTNGRSPRACIDSRDHDTNCSTFYAARDSSQSSCGPLRKTKNALALHVDNLLDCNDDDDDDESLDDGETGEKPAHALELMESPHIKRLKHNSTSPIISVRAPISNEPSVSLHGQNTVEDVDCVDGKGYFEDTRAPPKQNLTTIACEAQRLNEDTDVVPQTRRNSRNSTSIRIPPGKELWASSQDSDSDSDSLPTPPC